MPKVPSRRKPSAAPRVWPARPDAAERQGIELAHSQNFITDRSLVPRLVAQIDIHGCDTIVEIGPGRGALTVGLIQLAPHVLAVEADMNLAQALIRRFHNEPRLTVARGDFLDFPLPAGPFIVVANIPFNRTAEIVRKLTTEQSGLRAAYLILQREAAHKFSGQPPGPYSILSHFIQLEFSVKTLCCIPRTCFSPQPRVDAAFALFRKRKVPILSGSQARLFKDLLSYLYPRGPLLRDALRLIFTRGQVQVLMVDLGLDRGHRPSQVTFEEWLVIARALADHAAPAACRRIQGAHEQLVQEQARLDKRHRTSPR